MGGTLGLEQRHPSSGGTLLYRSTRLAAIAHCVTTGVCHGAEGPARLAVRELLARGSIPLGVYKLLCFLLFCS